MIEEVWNKSDQKLKPQKAGLSDKKESFETLFQSETEERDRRKDAFPKTPKEVIGLHLTHKGLKSADVGVLLRQISERAYTALFLSHNQIGDQGVKGLSKGIQNNKTIQHLMLTNNKLTDFAMAALADMLKVNHHIGWLVLNKNAIGKRGMEQLGECLPENKGIKHAVLSENQAGDEGLKGLTEGLTKNSTLESLFLRDNHISSKGITYLTEALTKTKSIKRIDVRDNPEIGQAAIDSLARIAKEKGIRLYQDRGVLASA